MSLRELSRLTRISNAYLSQVERGLHDPTLRILSQIGEALQISMSEILNAAATTDDSTADSVSSTHMASVEAAVRADPNLTTPEKDALLTVYRSYLNTHKAPGK
jgi:transcriptional regulator with XRE-family HTH domain